MPESRVIGTPSPADGPLDLERIVTQFEGAWLRGECPDIREYVSVDADRAVQCGLLSELIMVDLEFRWRNWAQGEASPRCGTPDVLRSAPLRLAHYLTRFSDLLDSQQPPLELICEEYRVRQRWGDRPAISEYLRRFPMHGPSLGGRLQEVGAELQRDEAGKRPTSAELHSEFQGTDRFLLGRRIGAGGMGVVHRAYDRERDEIVALKTLHFLDPMALYRLKREFRAISGFQHPNLVRLYELFAEGRHWFFTMEFVEGVHLLDYVRQGVGENCGGGPAAELPWIRLKPGQVCVPTTAQMFSEFIQVHEVLSRSRPGTAGQTPASLSPRQLGRLRAALQQLAKGLCVLHEAGMLHRDIKPSNVLVTREGRLVLLDFGLATQFETPTGGTTTELLAGTLPYMSPEQAAGRPLSPASDWYSVGVMLYESLVGHCPFQGSPLRILAEKQHFEIGSLRELAEGIPQDLDSLGVSMLRRDPVARPSGREVLRQLDTNPEEVSASSSAHPGPGRPPLFIGRDQPLALLTEALSCVQRRRTVVVKVEGRSGVGKTALLQQFLDKILESCETVILAGRCYERESVPYKALDSLVDALSHYLYRLPRLEAEVLLPRDVGALAQVFPVLRRVGAVAEARGRELGTPDKQELRERAFGALRELLTRLGDRKSLLLFIDDLQWGDLDSVSLLNDLLRPPDPPVFLLVLCFRSEDKATSPVLRMLSDSQTTADSRVEFRELELPPLDYAHAQALALALIGSADSKAQTLSEAAARESGGNPYFVEAFVRDQVGAEGALGRAGGGRMMSLDDLLWARAQRLPDAARRLLEVIAVAGHPLRQQDALRAAELSAEGREAVEMLRFANLVRITGGSPQYELETYHDRIRETVATRIAGGQSAAYHRRLALVLEGSARVDPATVATHFVGAEEPEKASKYYRLAADQAADALAFDRAVDLYRLAVEFWGAAEAGARDLHVRLADALANAGRGAEAAKEYLIAAREMSATEALEFRRRAAMQSLISGHIDEGLAALRDVLLAAGMGYPESPRRALWSLLINRAKLRLRGLQFRECRLSEIPPEDLIRTDICWSAAVGLSVVDPVRAADFEARSLLLALRAGDPYRIARSLATEAGHVSVVGGRACPRAERLIEMADSLARQTGHPHAAGLVLLVRGIAAFLQGRWRAAVQWCDDSERRFREHCTGVAWELNTAHTFSEWALFWLGEITELERRLPLLLAEAGKRGNLYALANLGTFAKPLVSMAADDADLARRELQELINRWSARSFHVQHVTGLLGQTQIDIYCGNGGSAWKRLTEQWPALAGSMLLRVQQVRIFMLHLRARGALAAADVANDPTPLLRVAEKDAQLLKREKMVWGDALAALLHAGIAASRGDLSTSKAALCRAIQGLDETDMALFAACARRQLGYLLGGEEGMALVRRADSWMTSQSIKNPGRMTALHTPGFQKLGWS